MHATPLPSISRRSGRAAAITIAALAFALAATAAAAQPAEEGAILRRAHDDSGMGFGPVSRTPSEFPDDPEVRPQDQPRSRPENRPAEAGFGYYYQWNPTTETWDVHYGYHSARYQFGPPTSPPTSVDPSPRAISEQPALSGTLESIHVTSLAPRTAPVAVAALRLDDGSARLVSLGRADDVASLQLTRGGLITVRGRQGSIGDRPVFMANALTIDGRSRPITQPLAAARQDAPGARPQPQFQSTRWREPRQQQQQQQQQQQPLRPQSSRSQRGEEWGPIRSERFFGDTGRSGVIEVPRSARAGGWDQADTGQWRTDEILPTTTGVGQAGSGDSHLFPPGYDPGRYDALWETTQPGEMQPVVRSSSTLSGEVLEAYYTGIPGVQNEDLVMRLTIVGGPERLVSFGPYITPYQLDSIENARSISIDGRTVDIGGYPVLLADRVTVDGSTFGVQQDRR